MPECIVHMSCSPDADIKEASVDEGTGTHSASADIWGTSIPQEGMKIDVTRAGANGAMLVTLQLLVHNMH